MRKKIHLREYSYSKQVFNSGVFLFKIVAISSHNIPKHSQEIVWFHVNGFSLMIATQKDPSGNEKHITDHSNLRYKADVLRK